MIQSLRLQNFRSYTDDSFEFGEGVTIVVGPNASGKTNLLEALLVSCRGSSYRVKDTELLAYDAPWARLDVATDIGVRTTKLIPTANGLVSKEFVIGDKPVKRLGLQHTLPVVLFEPNHLQLLHGSPEQRRDYLDDLLEQTTPGYGSLRRQYKRALAQRNRLLKLGKDQAGSQLFAWNIRLSQLGGELYTRRIALVTELSGGIEPLYQELAHTKQGVSMLYEGSCALDQYSSDMLHKLEQSTDRDFERGFTAHGPHRDDLAITLGGRPMALSASRGETRTMLLALKILELRNLEQARDKKPVLLLDDVFSELDGARRRALTELLASYQAFITTTDADVVVDHFMDTCTVIALG